MRKRHIRSTTEHMTLCGHRTTPGEWTRLPRDWRYVNCKRCIKLKDTRPTE